METVLVNNKEARVNTIGLARRNHLDGGRVMQLDHESITLLPGWNPVDGKLWEEAKKNPTVRDHYLARGIFEERALCPEEIKSLSEAEAERFVRETWDEGLLKRMRNAESRGNVLAAINLQLATLEPSPETKAKLEERAKSNPAAPKK